MTAKKLNPDSITLADVQKMTPREFRQYTFLKLNKIEEGVHKLDTRLWGVLFGIAITIGAVVISAV